MIASDLLFWFIEQKPKRIWIYRKDKNNVWRSNVYTDNSKREVEFQSINLKIDIDEIYEDVEF